ncbi:MAG TPA: protoporphyrinogen oxidase [Polyangiaceae bacterium]|nr:protoporphyrinogen oxidase [Polyangiaceae bacterium]
MRSGKQRVVVVGAGITGLSAAFFLRRRLPDAEVLVLESRRRAGGNIVTETQDGFLIDAGPDSFLRTKPHARMLCEELGIAGELVSPRAESRHVFVVQQGALVPMPGGMVLSVPTRLGPMVQTPLLSMPGKLRMLGDVLLPIGHGRRADGRDESIAEFVARRLGSEAAERIAGPLLGGIYAGDVRELSMSATFPQLCELEQRYGSVILGLCAPSAGLPEGAPRTLAERLGRAKSVLAWLRRDEIKPPQSPFLSFKAGMGTLVHKLSQTLGSALRLGAPVRRISARAGAPGLSLELESEVIDADAVLLATPAHVAAQLLPEGDLTRELAAIRYTSTATVFFAFARSSVRHSLYGSGFVVPRGEGELIAATWISSKWDERAPDGSVLLRAFVGGVFGAELLQRSDDEVTAIARFELERLLGPLGQPLLCRVYRYERCNPLPEVGHPERLQRLAALTRGFPGLHLAGAAYDGVGIPDCVRQADAAAERIARELGA